MGAPVASTGDAWPGMMRVESTRVAVLSDTHIGGDGWGLPAELLGALEGSDLILHCGDLDVLGVLDQLETIAPVRAVRGYPDPREEGERLAEENRVVVVQGVRIGMVHDIRLPGGVANFTHTLEFPRGNAEEVVRRRFGQNTDVVCFGDTHHEYIGWAGGILWVNPGSPTRPNLRHRPGEFGTFAVLDIKHGVVSAEIQKIHRRS